MLSDKPMSFSDILSKLTIDSAHLSYHLGNLGTLVSKSPDEKYQLSYVGRAALNLMYGIEEPKGEITKKKPAYNLVRLSVIILIIALILTGWHLTTITTYEPTYSLPCEAIAMHENRTVETERGNITFTTYIRTWAPPPENLVIDKVAYISVKCLFTENITQGTQGIYNVTIRYLEYSPVDGGIYIPKEKTYTDWFSPTEMRDDYIFRGFVSIPGSIGLSESQQPIPKDIVVTVLTNTSAPIKSAPFRIEAYRYGNVYIPTQPYRATGFKFIAAGTLLCIVTLITALFILPWWEFREITTR